MRYNKLKISLEATSKLRVVRQRTGLTPNLLCRLAAMLSMEEGPVGALRPPDEDGMEFNAYTLTGEHEALFFALLRFLEETAAGHALPDDELLARFRAHLHRGAATLLVRVKSPLDVARLVPAS